MNTTEDSFLKRVSGTRLKKKDITKPVWIYLKYSHVGIAVVVPIFLSLTLGILLDNLLASKPAFTGLALVLGLFISLYQLYKTTKEIKLK